MEPPSKSLLEGLLEGLIKMTILTGTAQFASAGSILSAISISIPQIFGNQSPKFRHGLRAWKGTLGEEIERTIAINQQKTLRAFEHTLIVLPAQFRFNTSHQKIN